MVAVSSLPNHSFETSEQKSQSSSLLLSKFIVILRRWRGSNWRNHLYRTRRQKPTKLPKNNILNPRKTMSMLSLWMKWPASFRLFAVVQCCKRDPRKITSQFQFLPEWYLNVIDRTAAGFHRLWPVLSSNDKFVWWFEFYRREYVEDSTLLVFTYKAHFHSHRRKWWTGVLAGFFHHLFFNE